MLKTLAIIFGVVFIAVGILGFVPGITNNNMLLGIFHVNAMHNIVHLLSGAVALATGFMGTKAARIYFQVFGVVYGLVALLGFVVGDGMLLGLISNNMADTWLHVVIAATALYLGFMHKD